jgi:hypothetical protein
MSRRRSDRNLAKARGNRKLSRRPRRLGLELLEDRTAPAVSVSFLAGVLTFTSDAAGDLVYLQSTAVPSTVQYNGGGLGLTTQAGVTQIIYNGNGGVDELVIAHAGGNILAPVGGIVFNGGGQAGDQLSLGGGGPTWTGIYNVGTATSGSISHTNGVNTANVTFTGTTKVRDSMTAASLTTNTPAGPDHVTIMNGPSLPDLPTFSQGPALIDGGDRDDHGGVDGGGNNIDGWKFIEQSVNFLDNNVFNSATNDILAIGVTGGDALAALNSVASALGLSVTIVTGASISTVDFEQYRILYVPGYAPETSGGISQGDKDLLATRTTAIRNFSNNGGGIFALTEAGLTNPFNWLQIPDPFSIVDLGAPSNPLRKTPEAIAAGLTISDAELSNGVPYHNSFVGPPGFNGLDPFVLDDGPDGIVGNGDDRIIALGNAAINSTPLGGGGPSLDVQFPAGATAFTRLCVNYKTNLIVNTGGGGDRVTITGTVLNNSGASPTLPDRININNLGGTDGIDATALNRLDVNSSTVSGKAGFGLDVNGVGIVNVTGGSYTGNGIDGVHIASGTTATMTNVSANGNADDGADINDVNTVNISGGSYSNNSDNGIELFGGAGLDDLNRTARITSAQIINNAGAGIYVDGDTNPADCTGDTIVNIGFLANGAAAGNRIEDNDVGIDVYGGCAIAMFNDIGDFGGGLGNNIGARLNEADGFIQLECNQIHGNGIGAQNLVGGGAAIEALLNWWGGGAPNTGGNDSTSGSVEFAPWAINSDCTGVPPPTITNEGDLVVAGTAGRDSIVVTNIGGMIDVSINNIPKFGFQLAAVTGHVVIYGFSGNDSINVIGKLVSEIHGGNGRDVISGGDLKDIIWGDAGDDYLQGQLGDDVLIGGDGRDRLSSGSGLDILLGGGFCKGNRHDGIEAYNFDVLCDISNSWVNGQVPDADLDGGLLDDVLDNHLDRLTGGYNHDTLPGGDWFLCNYIAPGMIDMITDFLAPDKRTDL